MLSFNYPYERPIEPPDGYYFETIGQQRERLYREAQEALYAEEEEDEEDNG